MIPRSRERELSLTIRWERVAEGRVRVVSQDR